MRHQRVSITTRRNKLASSIAERPVTRHRWYKLRRKGASASARPRGRTSQTTRNRPALLLTNNRTLHCTYPLHLIHGLFVCSQLYLFCYMQPGGPRQLRCCCSGSGNLGFTGISKIPSPSDNPLKIHAVSYLQSGDSPFSPSLTCHLIHGVGCGVFLVVSFPALPITSLHREVSAALSKFP